MIGFKNLPEQDDRCDRCNHECNEDCGNEFTPNLCIILGVRLEEEFCINTSDAINPYIIILKDGVAEIRDPYEDLIETELLFKVLSDPNKYVIRYYSNELGRAFKALRVLGYTHAVRNPSFAGITCDILFSNDKPYRRTNDHSWVTKGSYLNIVYTKLDPSMFAFISGDDEEPFAIPQIEEEDYYE